MPHRVRDTILPLILRSRQLHRFAAAAGAGLVRVVEDELRLHLVGLVVHLGAEQEQHRLGIDQDLDALVLDDLVGRLDVMGVFDGVGLPGAAAVLDTDAQSDNFGIGALGQFLNPRRGGFGEFHHLRTGPRFCLGGCSWCHLSHLFSPRGTSIPARDRSSFRDAPSWAQTRNPAPCTIPDSGFARFARAPE